MKPLFATGEEGQQNAANSETEPMLYKSESHTKPKQVKYTWWRILTGILCAFALGLFFAVLVSPLGHIDKMSNAKSMHFTRNIHGYPADIL